MYIRKHGYRHLKAMGSVVLTKEKIDYEYVTVEDAPFHVQ
jgi:hypothetical protein